MKIQQLITISTAGRKSSLHCSSAATAAPLLVLLISVLLLATTIGALPIVTRVNKDAATNLYTVAIKHGGVPLVLDLAGPLLWLACPSPHRTIPDGSSVCKVANRNNPPKCPYSPGGHGAGSFSGYAPCIASPYSPVDGRCGYGDTTTVSLTANATDGKNPLYPVSFFAVGSCAPGELLTSLHAGAAGVTGLSRQPLSVPSQVASRLKVAKQFALCHGTGGVTLSTVTSYTALRSDIYHPLFKAFDAVMSGIARMAAVKPFEMCYSASEVGSALLGFGVATIDLMHNGVQGSGSELEMKTGVETEAEVSGGGGGGDRKAGGSFRERVGILRPT